jgi:GT2 family glycosyltransferase
MALIAMAIFDTHENGRSELTRRTLESLTDTVDFYKHRLFLVINAATPETEEAVDYCFEYLQPSCTVIRNTENVGTARAINQAWKHRKPGENAIKMDNDVVIHRAGWVDEMEEAISRDPRIGIIGLKRKDLWETPWHPNHDHRSTLRMLPHEAGQKWLIVEDVNHVMGTCQMYSAALLEKIGYLYQPGLYGFDDSLAAIRCKVAGFKSCFLQGVEIDHIDPGGTDFTQWKRDKAGEDSPEYHKLKAGYLNGTIGVYYDADGNNVTIPTTLDTVERAVPRYSWAAPNLHTR